MQHGRVRPGRDLYVGGRIGTLSANTVAKVEYRHWDDGRGEIDYPSAATSGRFDVEPDRHQIAASQACDSRRTGR